VDLSGSLAGAYCTKLLADGGATVVKVEPPGGDPLRRWSSSLALTDSPMPPGRDGALFQYLHAGQQSVVADLGGPEGRDLVLDLAAGAGIVVEDLGPGRVDGLGLGHADLRGRNPLLSLVSISSFGWAGPWAGREATEFTLQA
jgi:crotonobetainyl-CoA:carnitine CoA-transferase CaiB-like acyl-CoA transferase